jgi:hypothetical protein
MSLHTTLRGAAWPLALSEMTAPRLSDGWRAFLSSRMVGEAATFNACTRKTCGCYSFTAPVIAET